MRLKILAWRVRYRDMMIAEVPPKMNTTITPRKTAKGGRKAGSSTGLQAKLFSEAAPTRVYIC